MRGDGPAGWGSAFEVAGPVAAVAVVEEGKSEKRLGWAKNDLKDWGEEGFEID
jgi:hypothetical protein